MTQVTECEEREKSLPAMTVADLDFIEEKTKEEMRTRTLGVNALPVIIPMIGSQSLNSQIAVYMRGSLQKKLWNFLIPEGDAESYLMKTHKDFMDSGDNINYSFYMNPYIQTSLFVNECVNLEMTLSGGMIRLSEKTGAYKDRYSSVSYGNWVISQFDKNLLREKADEREDSILDFLTIL